MRQQLSTQKEQRWTFVCGADERFGPGCGKTLTVDERFKNKDGTKKVPLEFSYDSVGQITFEPHKCPVKEELRRNQSEKMAKDVEELKAEIQSQSFKVDSLIEEIKMLRKLFEPQPAGGV